MMSAAGRTQTHIRWNELQQVHLVRHHRLCQLKRPPPLLQCPLRGGRYVGSVPAGPGRKTAGSARVRLPRQPTTAARLRVEEREKKKTPLNVNFSWKQRRKEAHFQPHRSRGRAVRGTNSASGHRNIRFKYQKCSTNHKQFVFIQIWSMQEGGNVTNKQCEVKKKIWKRREEV